MVTMVAAVDPRISDLAHLFLVDPVSGCWRFQGRHDKDGYGNLYAEGKSWRAHRYVYQRLVGTIPNGPDGRTMTLDHVAARGCMHRDCCNPAHLEPVTQTVNVKRTVPWNRVKTHCPRGHDYAETGVYHEGRDGYQRRYCTACNRERRTNSRPPSVSLVDAVAV
jgi:hypothetical protein